MDTTAAAELGMGWAGGTAAPPAAASAVGGGAAVAGVPGRVNEAGYWDGGAPGQEAYREQSYEPLSSHPAPNPSWVSAPGYGHAVDVAAPGTKGRALPAAGPEPPSKKMRNMPGESAGSHPLPDQGSTEYRAESAAAYGADLGYGEAPPGSAYARSAPGYGTNASVAPAGAPVGQSYEVAGAGGQSYGVPGAQSYGVTGAQSYAYPGGQSYGTDYSYQQMPAYGSNMSVGQPNYGPQQLPQQSYSGSAGIAGKGAANLFYKTKLCTKFKSGGCTFNERCTFAHGVEELRKPPPGWENMVNLGGGGAAGLRGAVPSLAAGQRPPKTRLCRYFVDGRCPYGERCNFLHGNQDGTPELQRYGGGSVHTDGGASVGVVQPAGEKTYSNAQNGVNGAAPNYGYWTEEKNWEVPNSAAVQPPVESQGYTQANQPGAWMAQYSVDGESGYGQYSQQQPVPFFRAGSTQVDPGSKPDVGLSYGQDDGQNKYQGLSKNGEVGYAQGAQVGYVQGAQSEPSYSGQQTDYDARYNASAAWGAKA